MQVGLASNKGEKELENSRKVIENIYWVGSSDRRLALFENLFPVTNGVSYNSYVILDEKTALMDTVDSSVSAIFLQNIEAALQGRELDYLVIHHMEPDHCSNIEEIVRRYPKVKLVGNEMTFRLLEQFYPIQAQDNYLFVKEGDELNLGTHNLSFVMTPGVHWPEVMMSYEQTNKLLFSADAFGTFASIDGNLFTNDLDFEGRIFEEARRYYVNIVGRFGANVLMALKKLKDLEIQMILTLHGPLYNSDTTIHKIMAAYSKWASYEPEEKSVLVLFGSMYGNTENAVDILAGKLSEKGVKNIKIHDISRIDPSYIMADMFRYSNIVFASPNYNTSLFLKMDNVIREALKLDIKNRKLSFIRNFSWGGSALEIMLDYFGNEENFTIVGAPVEINSSVKEADVKKLDELAHSIMDSLGEER